MTTTIDIPRIFTISESEHRIHNPFTAENMPRLAAYFACRRGRRSSTLAAVLAKCSAPGRGTMLSAVWALI